MPISEVVTEILQSNPALGGPTYTLQLPPQGAVPLEWLADTLTLEAYEAQLTKRTLRMENYERKLKVKTPEGILMTLKVDGRKPVSGVVKMVCVQLDIICPEEYGLISKKSLKPQEMILGNFESISNERSKSVFPAIFLRYIFRETKTISPSPLTAACFLSGPLSVGTAPRKGKS